MNLLRLHQSNPKRFPFLLQSTAKNTGDKNSDSRFDILFALPGQALVLNSSYELFLDNKPLEENNFLNAFDGIWKNQKTENFPHETEELPFTGGWFLFLSYELVSQIETSLGQLTTEKNIPVAMAVRCPAAIICNKHSGEVTIVAEQSVSESDFSKLNDAIAGLEPEKENKKIHINHLHEDDERIYLDNIGRVKQYIHDGDVFQVNLSRKWQANIKQGNAPEIYRHLCETNPGPFAGLARLSEECTIISSSPERLVSCKNNKVTTRPIAGTFPRNSDQTLDNDLPAALVANPKERAEHIMLIDLERNDLGRVCLPGSVEVSEMMVVETYKHVHHIVSQVEGLLAENKSPADIIRAVFPGGTITGCPKVRCMEIIRDMENCSRGAYTGAMGYINTSGDMDLNILIRTLVVEKNNLHFRAGSGLVADSEPQRELDETRAKAKGLIQAVLN
ncbi:MAG: aminodeoxychorismate synthase component I [Acidiferrobacterales bacterium]